MNEPADDTQRYLVDDITIHTACELHVKANNISALVAYGSALPVIHGGMIHGMPTCADNEKLEIDFVGGDGEKALGEALHGVIPWRKAYIKLIGNTSARMDPPSPPAADNDDDFDDHDPSPPSASSPPGQRTRSTPTPPALGKGKKN
jgi:hypothetical protein